MTMTIESPGPLPLDSGQVGEIELAPHLTVPYADVNFAPYVHQHIELAGSAYTWDRSFPVKGGSAVMPEYVAGLLAQGKQVLVAERGERYYVYLA